MTPEQLAALKDWVRAEIRSVIAGMSDHGSWSEDAAAMAAERALDEAMRDGGEG
jgi:hypothetical protein